MNVTYRLVALVALMLVANVRIQARSKKRNLVSIG
jgi:hypothetical protein